MKYVHSLLSILHHQLKVNRDFNVNFNLNMKYSSVRGKQKTLLISQHHWSPTGSHLFPPLPLPWPPALPLLPYTFCHPCCFWKFKKIGKKRAIICITNTCFLIFTMKMASPQRPTEALYLTVNKKLRQSHKQFRLRVVSKRLKNDIK